MPSELQLATPRPNLWKIKRAFFSFNLIIKKENNKKLSELVLFFENPKVLAPVFDCT